MARKAHLKSLGLVLYVAVACLGLAASAPLIYLPAYRYGHLVVVLEGSALVALVQAWRQYRRAPVEDRLAPRLLAVLMVVFGVVVAGSVDASYDTLRHAHRRYVMDLAPSRSSCGPFGTLGWIWNLNAKAVARTAFPGLPVHLARGCRWFEERGGYEVRVRVGPLKAPGLATRLLVTEEVTDKPGLEPYANAAAARADLARVDHLPGLVGAYGDDPRLCDLRDGDGGFGSGWFLACSPETAEHPLTMPCTGDIPCTTIGVADPSLPSVDTHRNLKSFGPTAGDDTGSRSR